jgi:hypothetical protein
MSSTIRNTAMTAIIVLSLVFVAANAGAAALSLYHEPGPGELLRDAAFDGNMEAATRLLAKGADVDWTHPLGEGWTPLFWAVHESQLGTVKLLLEKGAKVNRRDKLGCTPLYWASLTGNTEIIRTLLKHGAKTDTVDKKRGWSPLMRAAYMGHASAVELLAAKGADPNRKDKWGRSAVALAARNQKRETVKVLLSKGVTLDSESRRLVASLHGDSVTIRSMEHMKVVQYLNNGQAAQAKNAGLNGGNMTLVRAYKDAQLTQSRFSQDASTNGRAVNRTGRTTSLVNLRNKVDSVMAAHDQAGASWAAQSQRAKAERLIQQAITVWNQLQREFPGMTKELLNAAQSR